MNEDKIQNIYARIRNEFINAKTLTELKEVVAKNKADFKYMEQSQITISWLREMYKFYEKRLRGVLL